MSGQSHSMVGRARRCLAAVLLPAVALAAGCRGGPLKTGPSLDELIDARFEGETVLEAQRLRDVVRAELTSGGGRRTVSKAQVDDAAYALELHYREAGYPDAEVRYEYVEGRPPQVSFSVRPGPAVCFGEVSVEGASRLKADELELLLGPVKTGEPFVAKRVGEAARRLRDDYLRRGFLSVELDPPRVERPEVAGPDAHLASAGIVVREGPRHVIRGARVEGALEDLVPELNELAAAYEGRAFGPHVPFELSAAIRRAHALSGHPDCEVEVEVGEQADRELVFRVAPGPLVRIGEVQVKGNENVPDRRVKARVALEPGDVYDARLVNRSFDQLYSTGLFDEVRFDLVGDGAERRLRVDVVEAPSLQLFVEPGWGSYEGPRVRAGVDENNLFASGLRGKLEGWYSELARGVEVQVADPFLFGGPVLGQLTLVAKEREEPSFTVDEVGAGLDFRRAWTESLSTSAGIAFAETKLSDISVNGNVPQALLDSIDVGELTFALSYDTRDNVLMPQRGGLARFHAGVAIDELGSSIEAVENGLDLAVTLPVNERTQVAAAGRIALIQPYGDTDVIPLQRRLFNGGENTVRSFRESKLGPVDVNNDPLGGEARTLLSVELRRRLGGNLSGAMFYDLGNVELDYEDYFSFADFRHGVGIGVRYLLPIGPVRVDASWNPDHRSNESEFVVHFSVGLPY